MDAYLASADATAQFKTTKKATYNSHIKQYKDYCMAHDPESLNSEGEVIIPIKWNTIKGFIGKKVETANKRNSCSGPEEIPESTRQPYSSSHLGGFKSAIVDLYTRNRKKIDEEVNTQWKYKIGTQALIEWTIITITIIIIFITIIILIN